MMVMVMAWEERGCATLHLKLLLSIKSCLVEWEQTDALGAACARIVRLDRPPHRELHRHAPKQLLQLEPQRAIADDRQPRPRQLLQDVQQRRDVLLYQKGQVNSGIRLARHRTSIGTERGGRGRGLSASA
jgi:hypothetical protein